MSRVNKSRTEIALRSWRWWCATFLLCLPAGVLAEQGVRPKGFDFGSVGPDEDVTQTLWIDNNGSRALEIKDVQLTPPLVLVEAPSWIGPEKQGKLVVRLGTPRLKGNYQGQVVVTFKNESHEKLTYWIAGKIVEPIEFIPRPGFFVTTQRGQPQRVSLDILNHEREPLQIINVEHSSIHFTTEIETVKAGRHFRLWLNVSGEGLGGEQTDRILLVTSSHDHPFVEMPVRTVVNERLYTIPNELNIGTIPTNQIRAQPSLASSFTQQITVYEKSGKDFRVFAQTDIPFLKVYPAQAQCRNICQFSVAIVPQKLESGSVERPIVILTTDPEFPLLTIPVRATVDDDW